MNIERIFKLSGISIELYEAAYDPMVTKLKSNFPDHANDIDAYIKQAKAILKKQDRMVWYIKILSAFYAGNIGSVSGTYNFTTIENFNNDFFHYYGFNINEIENIQLLNQNISEVLDTFKELSEKFQKSDKPPVPIQHGDYELIKFPDGTAWWFVDRAFCDEEGRSGKHCGNVTGKNKRDQRILSLRTKNNQVILTFILEPNGFLGEMKAKSNQKPSEKYHPQIMQLLLNPMVKGIKGAGYAPYLNFSIFDLSEQNIQFLIQHNKGSFIRDQIKADPMDFLKAPEYIKNDGENQKIAILAYPALKSIILYNDWDTAIDEDEELLLFAPSEYYDEVRIIEILSNELTLIPKVSLSIVSDFKIMSRVIYNEPDGFKYILPNNPYYYKLASLALSYDGMQLEYVPDDHKTYDLCKIAISEDKYALEFVPAEFQERIKQELNLKESFNIERMLKLAGI